MAKKQDLKAIFKPTAAPTPSTKAEAAGEFDLAGNIKSLGVGLTTGEIAALGAIAESNGLTRNSLARVAIRYFLREVIAGRVIVADFIESKTTKASKMP